MMNIYNTIKDIAKELDIEFYNVVSFIMYKNFKNNIKKIEDVLKINICILTADDNNNVYTMFTSENNHPNDLNLFYYMGHICLIKDINKYLDRNNEDNNKKYFCVRCLNSLISEKNLNKHKDLGLKYNKKLKN